MDKERLNAVDKLSGDVGDLKSAVGQLIRVADDRMRSDAIEVRVRARADFTLVVLTIVAIVVIGLGVWTGLRVSNAASKAKEAATQAKIASQSNGQVLAAIQNATGPEAQTRSQQSIAAILSSIDATQRAELQQAINKMLASFGKPPIVLSPVRVTQPSSSPSPQTTTTTTTPSHQRRSTSPTTQPPRPTTTTTTLLPRVCVGSICVDKAITTAGAGTTNTGRDPPMHNINFVLLTAMGTLVFTIVNFLKYLTNRNWNAAVTQVIAWLAGWFVVFLGAQTQWAGTVAVGGIALDKMNWASLLLFGMLAASLLSTGWTLTSVVASQPVAAAAKLIPPLPHLTFSTTPPPAAAPVDPAPEVRVAARRRRGLPPDA